MFQYLLLHGAPFLCFNSVTWHAFAPTARATSRLVNVLDTKKSGNWRVAAARAVTSLTWLPGLPFRGRWSDATVSIFSISLTCTQGKTQQRGNGVGNGAETAAATIGTPLDKTVSIAAAAAAAATAAAAAEAEAEAGAGAGGRAGGQASIQRGTSIISMPVPRPRHAGHGHRGAKRVRAPGLVTVLEMAVAVVVALLLQHGQLRCGVSAADHSLPGEDREQWLGTRSLAPWYSLSWRLDNADRDKLVIRVSADTTGWVGFGIAESHYGIHAGRRRRDGACRRRHRPGHCGRPVRAMDSAPAARESNALPGSRRLSVRLGACAGPSSRAARRRQCCGARCARVTHRTGTFRSQNLLESCLPWARRTRLRFTSTFAAAMC